MPTARISSSRAMLFADTAEGLRLPILDVTNPAFAAEIDAVNLPARLAQYVEEETRRQKVPQWLMALFLRIAGRQSYLIRAMAGAKRGYLPALTTYLLKLGAANLAPPLDNDIDRRVVSTLPAQSLRLRLGQVAELMAKALVPRLAAEPEAPLHFINIAGGPAMDSINALLLIHRDDPSLLAGRRIVIEVLDVDPSGPAFGRNAVAALCGAGGPLVGITLEVRHIAWNWRDLEGLEKLLDAIAAQGPIMAVSSEGGLFEYGRDAEIVDCLKTLRQHTDDLTVIAGSVTRSDAVTLLFTRRSLFPIVPRGIDVFGMLAGQAGWHVAEARTAAFSDQVLLRRD